MVGLHEDSLLVKESQAKNSPKEGLSSSITLPILNDNSTAQTISTTTTSTTTITTTITTTNTTNNVNQNSSLSTKSSTATVHSSTLFGDTNNNNINHINTNSQQPPQQQQQQQQQFPFLSLPPFTETTNQKSLGGKQSTGRARSKSMAQSIRPQFIQSDLSCE
jgi:hypothetical protein